MNDINKILESACQLMQKGQTSQAAELYTQVLKYDDQDARSWANLGNALSLSGSQDKALKAYEMSVKLCPDNPMIRFNLGVALLDNDKLIQAQEHLEYTAQKKPDFAWAHERLGELYYRRNIKSKSLGAYDKAIELQPNDYGLKWRRCLAELSICYRNDKDLGTARENYFKQLTNLLRTLDPRNQEALTTAFRGLVQTPFYLAYQGRNDINLQRLYGDYISRVVRAAFPDLPEFNEAPSKGQDGRWRIGFISKYFARHSVWKIPLRGWLENIDKQKFSLYGYATTHCPDSPATQLCTKYIHGDFQVNHLAEIIARDNLHAIIFPEIGMDWKTVCLAALRLAPVQMAGAGHPQTTGLDSIDIFLSSKLMEPPDAQKYYTEKLVLLPNLSSYNYPSPEGAELSRKSLGLPEKDILYLSPQSLFKYLPQYDDIYARIAMKFPDSKFLFIFHDYSDDITACFRQRIHSWFAKLNLDPEKHVVFLPRLSSDKFTALCGLCDIFLDNIGWSGNNTSLEAIWQGTPVITLPLEMMRSRHAAANLQMTGVTETICSSVETYIQTAVDLGKDQVRRREITQKLQKKRNSAFGDKKCVREIENLLIAEISSTIADKHT